MVRVLFCGAALSLAAGLAQAQPPASTAVNPPTATPPTAAAPTATDTTAMVSPYRTGMIIKDAQGEVIGSIARVIKTPDGATTISANVGGRNINLPASALTIGPDGTVVSSMSKAQISASTKPPA